MCKRLINMKQYGALCGFFEENSKKDLKEFFIPGTVEEEESLIKGTLCEIIPETLLGDLSFVGFNQSSLTEKGFVPNSDVVMLDCKTNEMAEKISKIITDSQRKYLGNYRLLSVKKRDAYVFLSLEFSSNICEIFIKGTLDLKDLNPAENLFVGRT